MVLQPVGSMRDRLLRFVALQAEFRLVAGGTARTRFLCRTGVSPQPGGFRMSSRDFALVAPDAELFLVAILAGLGLLLRLSRMHLQPVLRMSLIALMAIGAEQVLMAGIACSGRSAELLRVLREPVELVSPLHRMAIRAEVLRVADLTALGFLPECGGVRFTPARSMRGRHSVAVVAEVLLVAPLAGGSIVLDLLFMPLYPLRCEHAGLPNAERLMTQTARIGSLLAIVTLEAGGHLGSVLGSSVRAVDYLVMAECTADPAVPVLLVADLQTMVDDHVSGLGMAFLAVLIGNMTLDRVRVHASLDVPVYLAHGGKLALGHVDHAGHYVAFFALDVLM